MVKPRYEFDEEQNAVIERLAVRLRLIGVICFVIGLIVLLMMAMRTASLVAIIVAGLAISFGALAVYAGRAFQKITTTQTRDIEHLMEALSTLVRIYNIQIAAIIFGAVALAYAVWNLWN
ncbi:MAG: hypothetical protein RML40_00135 [Bacteroidota bacterium]|nr:hypothetical protein [Candidatus Kapabacteria bacterium]MDW8218914.1 hypothetical protein [Bacteroidota bacterium]